MELLQNAFNIILYKPLFNALVLLYQYLPGHDFGIAVIILTIIIRLILYPLMVQSIRSQKVVSELQPKIQEIQLKYKNDKEKLAKATMELYQKEKINPFGGCLPLLIQLPILIALYQVFWKGLQPGAMVNLYSFVPSPGTINPSFLGIINLSKSFIVKSLDTGGIIEYYWPVLFLAILTGIAQFIQTKMITPKTKPQETKTFDSSQMIQKMLQKQMIYMLPVFTVYIVSIMPAAIGLYWMVTVLFSIIQQYLIYSKRSDVKL